MAVLRLNSAPVQEVAVSELLYLQFFIPEGIEQVPLRERSAWIKAYFDRTMEGLAPYLVGIRVTPFEYLLSAAVEGPSEACDALRRRLEELHLGELVPDATFTVAL
jgi:hypothetical protein